MNSVSSLLDGFGNLGLEIRRFELNDGDCALYAAEEFRKKLGFGYVVEGTIVLCAEREYELRQHTLCVWGGNTLDDVIGKSYDGRCVFLGITVNYEDIFNLVVDERKNLNRKATFLQVHHYLESFFHTIPASVTAQLLLGQLLKVPYKGRLGQMYREIKGMELILESMQQFFLQKEGCCEMCTMHTKCARVWQVMRDNLEHPMSIGELARTVGMSKTSLKRAFRAMYGDSIFASFQRHRMCEARKLLEESSYSIAEVAYRVGYESPGHFSRAFSRYYGVSPTKCRRGEGDGIRH